MDKMDTQCGFCWVRPKFLQRFATPRSFMLIYGTLGTVQAMAYIYFVVILTTMERRFKIPSKTTGIMLSGNELSQIMFSLFLSYFGGQRNRPRWIAWGIFICSLSCFILALPHFIYGPGEEALSLTAEFADIINNASSTNPGNTNGAQICDANRSDIDCNDGNTLSQTAILPVVLVFLSQFVLGIGNTLYFSLGNTYLDDNTKKTSTPMMLGWSCALRTFGPAIGFLLTPLCLSVYIDPSLTPLIDKNDPRWFGAWWLGWIVIGFVMLLFSFFVGLFPKHLPKRNKHTDIVHHPPALSKSGELYKEDEQPLKDQDNKTIPAQENVKMKDLPIALRRLLVNKILMANIMSGIFYILGSSAYITYMAKYIEVQFQRSAANATILTGPAVLMGMVGGFLLSGWFISRKQPRPRRLLAWNVLVGLFYLLGQVSNMFLSCPLTDVDTQVIQSRSMLITECNNMCACEGVKYSPVCHRPSNQLFFSACHAGCSTRLPGGQVFTNCTCIPSFESVTFENTHESSAAVDWNIINAGTCSQGCLAAFATFILVSTFTNILGSSGKIGNILVNYRCVEERDKSFAQGLMLLLISLFALIPGPILFGAIMDASCIEWSGQCTSSSNCILYDRDKFRIYVNAIAFCLTFFGIFFDVLVWYWGKDLDLYGHKEEQNKQQAKLRDSSYN